MRLKSFRNPEKKKWIKFEIVLAVLTSFLLHLPYYFQEDIIPSFCTEDQADDVGNVRNSEDIQGCWTHVDVFKESALFKVYSFVYQV